MNRIISSDYLIIGCGLAGLNAAHYASKYGSVSILTKHTLQTSSTFWAQGGIAAAMNEDDSPELHFDDTMDAGRGLSNKEAVRILVNEGPTRINELINEGLAFDRDGSEFAFGLEGGHSRRRILHIGGNETGRMILEFLTKKISDSKKITVYENFLVHKLFVEGDRCLGLFAYNWKDKSNYLFLSKIILMASGGAAGVYKRSTNPDSSIGDGISLAYNAGAEITNMEFIQFHPTAFFSESGTTFLLSEALRGEGGYLLDNRGQRFMLDYHKAGELAPRDIVSKAIYEVLKSDNSTNIFLSLVHLDQNKIKTRFKNLYEKALEYKIDITKDRIPVAPAAHYTVGGVNTNLNGETKIKRFFAAGEVAHTGVHGANRLASNSLLECLVFSYRAMEESQKYLGIVLDHEYSPVKYYVYKEYDIEYLNLKKKITEIMNQYVGIVRSKENLKEALKLMIDIDANWVYKQDEYYSDRLRSLKSIALLIINGALAREETRGCHIRNDFPEESKVPYNIFQSNTTQIIKKDL